MSKFFDKFIKAMDKVSDGVSRINILMAIKDSFIDLMPLIIVGSFGTLFSSVICDTKNGLAQFGGFEFLANFKPLFAAINFATMSIMSIYLVYLVAATYAKYKDIPSRPAGLCALACFTILLPTVYQGTNTDGTPLAISNVIQSKYVDSKGLFLALVVGIISTIILSAFSKSDALKIKMPPSVPSGVSKSFAVLFPILFTCFVFGVIGFAFNALLQMPLADAIYQFLQKPMEGIMQYPAGVIILVLFCQFFWIVGIHGSNIVDVVRSSVGLATIATNLEVFNAGGTPTNIFTYTFWNTYCTIGGSGCTIGLLIAIFLVSKREDAKSIAKLGVAPSFFGINEPVIFGLPIVLNPILAIPFILAPVVSAAIGYVSTMIGFAAPAIVTVPWTTPFILNAYLSTGGSVGTVITQIICIVVVTLIYLPFVKIMNSQKVAANA